MSPRLPVGPGFLTCAGHTPERDWACTPTLLCSSSVTLGGHFLSRFSHLLEVPFVREGSVEDTRDPAVGPMEQPVPGRDSESLLRREG